MIIEQLHEYDLAKKALKLASLYNKHHEKKLKAQKDAERLQLLNLILEISVSEVSLFKHNIWNLTSNEINPQQTKKDYTVKWKSYPNIPKELMLKLKLLTFISTIDKRLFSLSTRPADLSIATIVTKIRYSLRFFNECFKLIEDRHGIDFASQITSLSGFDNDILVHVAKNNLKGSPVAMRESLGIFEKVKVLKVFGEQAKRIVKFSELPFRELSKEDKKPREHQFFIPSEQFFKLDSDATLSVVDFLYALGSTSTCKASTNAYKLAIRENRFNPTKMTLHLMEMCAFTFRTSDLTYKDNLDELTEIRHLYGFNEDITYSKTYNGFKKYGTSYSEIRRYLDDIQTKAVFLLWSYTGMRPAEFFAIDYLNKNSIIENDGLKEIFTTILKGRQRTKLFNDHFVLIPIAYDAFRAIKKIKEIYRSSNSHLDSYQQSSLIPQNSIAIKGKMQSFFDNSATSDSCYFYPYLFRHNLAYQLYRAGLGLPYISYALKHVVQGLDRFKSVSNVTLGYGSIGDELAGQHQVSKSLQKHASKERIKAQFDPDGSYSGGGATKHKERLKIVFQGYMASGYSKEEIFEKMAEHNYYLLNVGRLYCMANEAYEKFDKSLPCVGGLRCNPVECHNALITNEHKSVWQEVKADNIALKSSLESKGAEFQTKKERIDAAIDISICVLSNLKDEG